MWIRVVKSSDRCICLFMRVHIFMDRIRRCSVSLDCSLATSLLCSIHLFLSLVFEQFIYFGFGFPVDISMCRVEGYTIVRNVNQTASKTLLLFLQLTVANLSVDSESISVFHLFIFVFTCVFHFALFATNRYVVCSCHLFTPPSMVLCHSEDLGIGKLLTDFVRLLAYLFVKMPPVMCFIAVYLRQHRNVSVTWIMLCLSLGFIYIETFLQDFLEIKRF